MLRKNMINKTWNQNLARTCVKQFSSFDSGRLRRFRPFATSSQIESDYEIDLISLKKTPKNNGHNVERLYLNRVKQVLFTKSISKESESLKTDDQLGSKTFEKDDHKEFLDFVQRYYDEMQVFLKFLMDSYNGKIITFGQLTSTELSNSLYVFKDYYTKNKIPQVNRYNYISYNYMFTRLLKYLGRFPNFPKVLTNELLPNVNNGHMILTLYKNKITNFTDELKSLSNEFNFLDLTLRDLSSEIDSTLSKFNGFVASNSKFDTSYFQVVIQARRYQSLKEILDMTPSLEAKYLILLINDPELSSVSNRLQEISNDKQIIERVFEKYERELGFIKFFLAGESFDNFAEFSSFIYKGASSSENDEEVKAVCNKVLCGLSSLYGKGILKCNDMRFLEKVSSHSNVKISENVKENYETSLSYDLGIYKYADSLRYLNSFMGGIENASIAEIMENLNSMLKSFKGNKIILEKLTSLREVLDTFFSRIPWKRTSLYLLVQDLSISSSLKNISETTPTVDLTKRSVEIQKEPSKDLLKILSEYSNELNILKEQELGGYSFSDSSYETVLKLLNDILSSSSSSHPSDFKRFEELSLQLSKYFNDKIAIGCLDDLASKNIKPYLQIPEELQIHKFYKELDILKGEILMTSFADSSSEEILSALNKSIDTLTNDPPDSYPSRVNRDNLVKFVKLSKKLERLFKYNGGYTAILDTVVHSQSVFENFENRKSKTTKKEYKQIPDDFFIEQYLTELIQLKEEFGISFKNLPSYLVLEKIGKLMNKEKNLEKKVIWRKLLYNLSNLFKINNNSTFVLDDVLINGERFLEIESQLAFNKLSQNSSIIGKHSKLFNEYFDDISDILRTLNLVDKLGIWNMSESEFNRILQYHLGTLDKSLPGYQIKRFLIDSMKEYNSQIDYYPNFLQQLFEIKQNNFNKVLSTRDTEEIYKALIENIEYEDNNQGDIMLKETTNSSKPRIPIPTENITSEFNMNEFTGKVKNVNSSTSNEEKYHNSEEVLSNLIRNEQSVDLDSNQVLRGSLRSFPDSVFKVQDAVTTALRGKSNHESQEDRRMKESNMSSYDKKIFTVNSKEKTLDPVKVNKSSVEDFLLNAQKEKKMAKERKFRESKAYDWSKSMYKSHRSLESHNFFNPLYDFNLKSSRISTETPLLEKIEGGNEYMLLLLSGKTIKSDVNPLGKEPAEDIFKILNKFNKKELNRFLKYFKRLQRRNWKLIGSKSETNDQKYLILWRNSKPGSFRSKLWRKLKMALATTGVVFILLLGFDFWTSPSLQANTEKSEQSSVSNTLKTVAEPERLPEKVENPPHSSITSYIKKIMWSD